MTAGKIDVQPSKPRTAGKQRHRANAQMEDDSIEGFYRVSVRQLVIHLFNFSKYLALISSIAQCYSCYSIYLMLAQFRFFSPHISFYEANKFKFDESQQQFLFSKQFNKSAHVDSNLHVCNACEQIRKLSELELGNSCTCGQRSYNWKLR